MQCDKETYKELIEASFGFVESEFGMRVGNVRASGGVDPRDAALVARYSGSTFRFDVGWNEFELSLAVLINYDKTELSRQDRYVYFEPFVEFLTDGKESAIVPYLTEKMSVRQIEVVMEKRRSVFENGLTSVVEQVAQKMHSHFDDLINASCDQIHNYHQWMKGA